MLGGFGWAEAWAHSAPPHADCSATSAGLWRGRTRPCRGHTAGRLRLGCDVGALGPVACTLLGDSGWAAARTHSAQPRVECSAASAGLWRGRTRPHHVHTARRLRLGCGVGALGPTAGTLLGAKSSESSSADSSWRAPQCPHGSRGRFCCRIRLRSASPCLIGSGREVARSRGGMVHLIGRSRRGMVCLIGRSRGGIQVRLIGGTPGGHLAVRDDTMANECTQEESTRVGALRKKALRGRQHSEWRQVVKCSMDPNPRVHSGRKHSEVVSTQSGARSSSAARTQILECTQEESTQRSLAL
eukprot:SAG11_NODE_3935_length_2142_cov_23.294175_2_plen_300_part_00